MGPVFRYRVHLIFKANEMKKPWSFRVDVISPNVEWGIIRTHAVLTLRAQALGTLTGLQILSMSTERQEL